MSANPNNIVAGDSVELSWTVNNADRCTASGDWSGNKVFSGSESLSPVSDATYILTCEGAGGSAVEDVTILVSTPPSESTTYQVGAKVHMNRADEIRANPGGRSVGINYTGVTGEIIAGPGSDDGLTWWEVDFATGPDGWVSQTRLELGPAGQVQGVATSDPATILGIVAAWLQNLLNNQ
jgi:hypothetical protein